MASDDKKTKADTTPKTDTAAKAKSTAAEAAPKDAPKDSPKNGAKDAPKEGAKSEAAETAGKAPANYSRGEGQKPVTAAYKENWNAIFGKKSTKRKKK